MAIAFRSAFSNSQEGGTGLPLNRPAGSTTGDLLIAALYYAGTSSDTLSTPSGWTRITQVDVTNRQLELFWHLGDVGDPSSWTWSNSLTEGKIGGICAYTGADTTTAYDTGKSGVNGTSTSTPKTPVSATHYDGALVVGVFVAGGPNSGTWTPPSGMTERVDQSTSTTSGTSLLSMEIADLTQTTYGQIPSYAATTSGSTGHGGYVLTLIPSGGTYKSLFNRWGAIPINPR